MFPCHAPFRLGGSVAESPKGCQANELPQNKWYRVRYRCLRNHVPGGWHDQTRRQRVRGGTRSIAQPSHRLTGAPAVGPGPGARPAPKGTSIWSRPPGAHRRRCTDMPVPSASPSVTGALEEPRRQLSAQAPLSHCLDRLDDLILPGTAFCRRPQSRGVSARAPEARV